MTKSDNDQSVNFTRRSAKRIAKVVRTVERIPDDLRRGKRGHKSPRGGAGRYFTASAFTDSEDNPKVKIGDGFVINTPSSFGDPYIGPQLWATSAYPALPVDEGAASLRDPSLIRPIGGTTDPLTLEVGFNYIYLESIYSVLLADLTGLSMMVSDVALDRSTASLGIVKHYYLIATVDVVEVGGILTYTTTQYIDSPFTIDTPPLGALEEPLVPPEKLFMFYKPDGTSFGSITLEDALFGYTPRDDIPDPDNPGEFLDPVPAPANWSLEFSVESNGQFSAFSSSSPKNPKGTNDLDDGAATTGTELFDGDLLGDVTGTADTLQTYSRIPIVRGRILLCDKGSFQMLTMCGGSRGPIARLVGIG